MPKIAAIRHALPVHRYPQDAIAATVRELFAGRLDDPERIAAIFANARIEARHLVMPLDWYRRAQPPAERNRLYLEHGLDLLEEAARQCLAVVDWPSERLDQVVCVSTTGHATPSLDAHLLQRLGAAPAASRVPIWGLGCAAGVAGLARACDYCIAYPERAVLLGAVECCSLTLIQDDLTMKNLIGTALFGDGAAAALVVGDAVPLPGPAIRASGSHLFPDSFEVMGWRFGDRGMELVLAPDLPALVERELPRLVDQFLQGQEDASFAGVTHHLPHPGGARVLEAYGRGLGLPDEALALSAGVLARVGNLSSATILLVLEEWLARAPAQRQGRGLVTAFGPGFSAEFLLLEEAG